MGMAFMGGGKRGLFGAPMASDKMPVVDPRAAEGAGLVQQDATVPTYAKPSTANLIIGTLGDTLSQLGGGRGSYLPGLQMRQAQAAEAAQYQQRRADEYSDWERKQAYEAAHPKAPADDSFARALAGAGIDPTSPQGRALYNQRAQSLANPAQFIPDGAGGGQYVRPNGTPPAAPVGKLTPLGGATPQGARTFPVR